MSLWTTTIMTSNPPTNTLPPPPPSLSPLPLPPPPIPLPPLPLLPPAPRRNQQSWRWERGKEDTEDSMSLIDLKIFSYGLRPRWVLIIGWYFLVLVFFSLVHIFNWEHSLDYDMMNRKIYIPFSVQKDSSFIIFQYWTVSESCKVAKSPSLTSFQSCFL